MSGTLKMSDKQHCPAGITVLDEDGQPYAALPDGASADYSSSDPSVADFAKDETGLNGDVTSGKVGSCSIAAKVTFADGKVLEDTISVIVENSAANSLNFTPGTPVDE